MSGCRWIRRIQERSPPPAPTGESRRIPVPGLESQIPGHTNTPTKYANINFVGTQNTRLEAVHLVRARGARRTPNYRANLFHRFVGHWIKASTTFFSDFMLFAYRTRGCPFARCTPRRKSAGAGSHRSSGTSPVPTSNQSGWARCWRQGIPHTLGTTTTSPPSGPTPYTSICSKV